MQLQANAIACYLQKVRLAAEDIQDLTRAQLSTACAALEHLTQEALQTFNDVIEQSQQGSISENEALEAQVRKQALAHS